jgi:outer membrane protein TolC
MNNDRHWAGALSRLAAGTMLAGVLAAQQSSYTIARVVEEAQGRYAAIRVSSERLSAAAAAINLAKTSYLPRFDFLAQMNRATRNNVTGMLLPQSTIPGISGPPRPENDMASVWGTAVGTTLTWEPFDFGQRRASVDLAESGRRIAEAGVARTRFEISTAAADAFLTVAAAEQTAVAAQAGVERSRVLTQMVDALVNSQLRPGADASRARAELAVSENQLIRAQTAIDVAKAGLAQFLAAEPGTLTIDPGAVLKPAGPGLSATGVAESHPVLQEQQSNVEQAKASRRVLDRSYYPRFLLQGSSYARGTGATASSETLGGANGLGPNIYNWGLAMSVTFPLFDLPSIKARREMEQHRERAETARFEQLQQDLTAGVNRARANLDGARRIARNTPIQLEAARTTEQQIGARYKAGLATVIEVAESQRLVTQAEIDDALAKLGVWRGLLQVAAAQGSLEPFLQEAGK